MSFTGKSRPLLLVHRQMEPVSPEGMVDIMLTPQFYTIKKEDVPVSTTYRAKKIAPSLMEDLVASASEQAYFVYREKGSWVFIAYSPDEVAAFLREKGIDPAKVGKIFFAQQLAEVLDRPIPIGEMSLGVVGGVVTVLPSAAQKELSQPFSDLPRPKRSVRSEMGHNPMLTKQQTYLLAGIGLEAGMIWVAESFQYRKNYHAIVEEKQALYSLYPVLKNPYKRDNIAKKYKKIDSMERAKRDIVKKLAALIYKGVTLSSMQIDEKHYRAVFEISDPGVRTRVERLAGSTGLKVLKKESSQNRLTLEGTL